MQGSSAFSLTNSNLAVENTLGTVTGNKVIIKAKDTAQSVDVSNFQGDFYTISSAASEKVMVRLVAGGKSSLGDTACYAYVPTGSSGTATTTGQYAQNIGGISIAANELDIVSPTILPVSDNMVWPMLCVAVLFVLNRWGDITRNEAYTAGLALILLYLPFTRHSLELAERGLSLRYSIIPRCRHVAWAELRRVIYSRSGSGDKASLRLIPSQGRSLHITLDLTAPDAPNAFALLLAEARCHLGPDAVVEKPSLFHRIFC